jgi:hypothetical protein
LLHPSQAPQFAQPGQVCVLHCSLSIFPKREQLPCPINPPSQSRFLRLIPAPQDLDKMLIEMHKEFFFTWNTRSRLPSHPKRCLTLLSLRAQLRSLAPPRGSCSLLFRHSGPLDSQPRNLAGRPCKSAVAFWNSYRGGPLDRNPIPTIHQI